MRGIFTTVLSVTCALVFLGFTNACHQKKGPGISEVANDAKETKPLEGANVDAALKNIDSEFRRRLVYYNGTLLSLTLNDGRIVAEWRSQKCDWVREEVIDLAISINRGYSASVNGIDTKRTCDSTTKEFSISGAKFNQYKSGEIGDPQFLEGIK